MSYQSNFDQLVKLGFKPEVLKPLSGAKLDFMCLAVDSAEIDFDRDPSVLEDCGIETLEQLCFAYAEAAMEE